MQHSDEIVECSECGGPHKLNPREAVERRQQAAYERFVEENRGLVRAVESVLEAHIIENRAGSRFNAYAWPESEAVAVIRAWPQLCDVMGTPVSGAIAEVSE